MKKFLTASLAFLSLCAAFAADVFLVKDGKAKAVIVVEDAKNVTAQKAAEEFQTMLEVL